MSEAAAPAPKFPRGAIDQRAVPGQFVTGNREPASLARIGSLCLWPWARWPDACGFVRRHAAWTQQNLVSRNPCPSTPLNAETEKFPGDPDVPPPRIPSSWVSGRPAGAAAGRARGRELEDRVPPAKLLSTTTQLHAPDVGQPV